MSENKHTPGPWHIRPTHFAGLNNIWADHENPIGQTWNGEADARLIAAAPDLLAAAERALGIHEDVACSCDGCADLRAAIKKAKGK